MWGKTTTRDTETGDMLIAVWVLVALEPLGML